MSSAATGKTEPLQPGGALMLGNEQDCYGGCTDISQAYNGLIDEVCVRAALLDRSVCVRQLKDTQDVNMPALIQRTWAIRCASGASSGSKRTSSRGCGDRPGWRTTGEHVTVQDRTRLGSASPGAVLQLVSS